MGDGRRSLRTVKGRKVKRSQNKASAIVRGFHLVAPTRMHPLMTAGHVTKTFFQATTGLPPKAAIAIVAERFSCGGTHAPRGNVVIRSPHRHGQFSVGGTENPSAFAVGRSRIGSTGRGVATARHSEHCVRKNAERVTRPCGRGRTRTLRAIFSYRLCRRRSSATP